MERGSIFIGGPDRCGKTTMRAFLTSHPNIAIPAVGSNMWTYFYGQYGDISKEDNFERCLDAMLHYKHVAFLKPDPERIRREFWQGTPTYARLFSLFLIHYAERKGKPRWGAQTGLIERYADHVFAAYPQAKIIQMVRDPRDRYEASLALWPNGKLRAGGATARWLYSAKLAERNLNRYPGRYLTVRYESLVSEPEETLHALCLFLEEEYSSSMLTMDDAVRFRHKITKDSDYQDGQIPVNTKYIGRYRGAVPKDEISYIQSWAGREMLANDYELEPIQFLPAEKLRYRLVDWPINLFRMLTWWSLELVQHRFPGLVGRTPSPKMILKHNPSNKRDPVTS